MRRARVLCLMQLPPPVHGVTQINELVANSLVLRERFELEVIPLRFSDTVDDLRRPSLQKLWRAARTAAQLASVLASRRPDLVYVTLAPSGPAFYRDCAYVALLQLAGVERVFHLHAAGIAEHLDSHLGSAVTRAVFSGASVIHLAPSLRADTAGVVPEERVHYVANGLPMRPATRRPRSGHGRVLFLSNMLRTKGPLTLLAALASLAKRGIAVHATFAGAPFHDGCVEELVQQIRDQGLEDLVRYIGPVYGDAKDSLLMEHDVFVLPTTQDAFPMVILEAMRAGLPVVASDVGAIPDIVVDGETGFVVPPGSVDVLANRIAALLGDDHLRESMGTRARVRFEERYTAERFEHALADVLDSVLSEARTQSRCPRAAPSE